MMPALATALRAVRRLPWEAWAVVGVFVGLVLAWWSVASYGASRYEDGRRSVHEAAAYRAALAQTAAVVAAQREAAARAATDTVVQRVTVTRRQVDTVVVAVPDSLRAVPEVAALIRTATTLGRQVDSLLVAIDAERAAARLRAAADSAALVAAHVVIDRHAARIAALERRTTWPKVVGGAVLGAAAGWAVRGVVR